MSKNIRVNINVDKDEWEECLILGLNRSRMIRNVMKIKIEEVKELRERLEELGVKESSIKKIIWEI